MAERPFSDLIPKIALSLPGCPNPTILQYVRDGARDVCERSLYWRREQASITLSPGVYEYEYVTPTCAEVHSVMTARVNGTKMNQITLDDLHTTYPRWPEEDTGTPRAIATISPDEFVVAPVPNDDPTYVVNMTVVLKPKRTADGIDDVILNDIEQAVVHYVLQHLYLIPGKDWASSELAGYHARQYAYRVAQLRAQANIGTARGSLYAQPQPFE